MQKEDPLAWDRQVRLLAEFDENYSARLRLDPEKADLGGPFVGVPAITEREAFSELRALPIELPVRRGLERWMFRLADARVNSALLRAQACFWRTEPFVVESQKERSFTRAELLSLLLSDAAARTRWLSELERALVDAPGFVSELWQRRQELATRAGFESLTAVLDPVEGMRERAEQWRAATDALSSDVLPRDPLLLLDVAQANGANQGWPARMVAPAMASLLGDRTWLRLGHVKAPTWPRLLSPTSFLRALHRLGQALARAWAPESYPFAVSHDPWNLPGHRLGALLSSLPLNESWQRRVLGLSRDQARLQVRALSRSVLLASRGLCLKLAMRDAALVSSKALKSAHCELTSACFGFELPVPFAGWLPRIGRSDAQRLAGFWLGLYDHEQLIQTIDEDWYRNPRAIEMLRGQSLEALTGAPNAEALGEALKASAAWFSARLNE